MSKKENMRGVDSPKKIDKNEFVEFCGGEVLITPEIEKTIKNKK